MVLGGVGIAALHRPPTDPNLNPYLNPDEVSATGTHALADILTGLGHQVVTANSVPAAERAATRGSTLVITSPGLLSSADLAALGRVQANVVLVEPDPVALAAVASPVGMVGVTESVVVRAPTCRLRAATVAGTADMGGEDLVVPNPSTVAQECYPGTSGPSLIQVLVRGRTVTVLGTGAPLTNAKLAIAGNASLAINLLPSRRIVWLAPDFATVTAGARAGPRSFASLLPLAAYLVTIQLVIAAVLTAAWRARRLGQLVAEPIPVVVRAAETTEGHGRLYQARHARAQAAEALRGAVRSRIELAVGLPADAGREAVVGALAQRTAAGAARISELLYGPAPLTDQALVNLARDLDQLEREVGMT